MPMKKADQYQLDKLRKERENLSATIRLLEQLHDRVSARINRLLDKFDEDDDVMELVSEHE